tara:strand:- start:246 stop:686 length:441 start_codon:yes stop_codon:yes gene_type:complete
MKTRRRTTSNLKKLQSNINVVPYIDVMLVLLVIFMITAPLLNQGMQVKLPQSQGSAIAPKKKSIIISIDRQGRYYVNINNQPNHIIDKKSLLSLVSNDYRTSKTPPNVYIKADKDVEYGRVAEAISILKKSGAKNVGLFTQPTNDT